VTDAVRRALGGSAIFGGLDPNELDRLARECRVLRFTKDEQVFARGDVGGGMYLVAEGSVALSMTSAGGGQIVLAVLRPPQTLGDLAVIDSGPRVATATARQPTVLVGIPRPQVQRLLRVHPSVGEALLTSLARLIRRLDDQASDLMLLDLQGRVCKHLSEAAEHGRPGAPAGTLVPVDLSLTQTELAAMVGGSRQQVNRVIVSLERRGAIRRHGSRIVAVRPDLLG
jgi:CRP/FNR family transcriptional regulator, cyclic AMP receptor protein